MNLEVLSNQSQATNWILAGLKRRDCNFKYTASVAEKCKDVAEELKMDFELKQDGTLLFKDKQ